MQPNILQENQLLAWEEVVEHTVGHSFGEGTLVEGNLVQGTLVEGKRPFLDTLEGEEHQLEAVADDRSSSCW